MPQHSLSMQAMEPPSSSIDIRFSRFTEFRGDLDVILHLQGKSMREWITSLNPFYLTNTSPGQHLKYKFCFNLQVLHRLRRNRIFTSRVDPPSCRTCQTQYHNRNNYTITHFSSSWLKASHLSSILSHNFSTRTTYVCFTESRMNTYALIIFFVYTFQVESNVIP